MDAVLDPHMIPDLANITKTYLTEEKVDESPYNLIKFTTLNGLKHGKYCLYKKDTRELLKECDYIYDVLHGPYRTFICDSKTKLVRPTEEGTYVNGQKHGVFTYYKYCYLGDLLISHKVICNYVNGILHGVYEAYDEGKRLSLRCYFNNGVLHGEYKEYHKNGLTECTYVNGILHGEYKIWLNKKLLIKKNYVNGILNGPYFEKQKASDAYEEGYYVNGKKQCIMNHQDIVNGYRFIALMTKMEHKDE